jgi:hypothetical protein
VIERSIVPLLRGSTADDPLPCSVAGALTSLATVNGVEPFGGLASRTRSTRNLGCRVCHMVAVVARAVTARVLLVVMVPLAGTMGVVLPPLVRSCGGDNAPVLQEPGVVEPNVEEPYVEEPSGFRRGHARSSGE